MLNFDADIRTREWRVPGRFSRGAQDLSSTRYRFRERHEKHLLEGPCIVLFRNLHNPHARYSYRRYPESINPQHYSTSQRYRSSFIRSDIRSLRAPEPRVASFARRRLVRSQCPAMTTADITVGARCSSASGVGLSDGTVRGGDGIVTPHVSQDGMSFVVQEDGLSQFLQTGFWAR